MLSSTSLLTCRRTCYVVSMLSRLYTTPSRCSAASMLSCPTALGAQLYYDAMRPRCSAVPRGAMRPRCSARTSVLTCQTTCYAISMRSRLYTAPSRCAAALMLSYLDAQPLGPSAALTLNCLLNYAMIYPQCLDDMLLGGVYQLSHDTYSYAYSLLFKATEFLAYNVSCFRRGIATTAHTSTPVRQFINSVIDRINFPPESRQNLQ